MSKAKVLFLCTGNSARSQMAEGFLRSVAGGCFDVLSAGTDPRGVNPLAVEVMQESGVDISHHRSKDVGEFIQQRVDWVVTVCDRAKNLCPVFPFAFRKEHWSLEDPAEAGGTKGQRAAVFRRIRDEIEEQVRDFAQRTCRELHCELQV
jgi:arsenate reductase